MQQLFVRENKSMLNLALGAGEEEMKFKSGFNLCLGRNLCAIGASSVKES
ncbi:MAG: hypothetical protein QOF64_1185 [Candidatus Binatota bacterium]|jgi:hypothetical protein|nr:hypothetical protein [Candidatus Binatota bacterium]